VDSQQQEQQQGQQQELLQAAHSQHVVKLMANRVSSSVVCLGCQGWTVPRRLAVP